MVDKGMKEIGIEKPFFLGAQMNLADEDLVPLVI